MAFEQTKDFFKDLALWQKVVAGLIVAIVVTSAACLKRIFKKRKESNSHPPIENIITGPDSPSQLASGSQITQNFTVDKSQREGKGINIECIESGATVVINYVDGLPETPNPEVKSLFEKGRAYYQRGELSKAIDAFKSCLTLEREHEKLGALNLQIGNCYYDLHRYIKAAEFYALGLQESRKANDQQGQASNFASIANTYLMRPSSSGAARGDNVRQAILNYENALKIFIKDEYPVDYAMTQNNLGTAYTYLPAATPEQRAQNVRNAIDCYKAALEIRKKDEYPQNYCQTAANMGLILAEIEDKEACNWLKEAYALRQFLPDQGKRLEDVMNRVCK